MRNVLLDYIRLNILIMYIQGGYGTRPGEGFHCYITTPLHVLTSILSYPNFSHQFQLHTDASATSLRAVLEQGGKILCRRTLTTAEKNDSMIQRECLAIIFAFKQFHHYLLGKLISLLTDHA